MRKIGILVVMLCIISLACSSVNEWISGEMGNVESVSQDDSEMNDAIKEAQETLPLFIQAFETPTSTQTHFSIKVRFPYGEGSDAEHMWINELVYSNGQFTGFLGNEPLYVNGYHLGDEIVCSPDQISDWMIIDNNRLLGGFTIHVLRNAMTSEDREKLDNQIGFIVPDEPELP